MMNDFKLRERGAVALETIIVIALWFFVVFLFLNVLFVLASASLAQSGVNRYALEVGSLGCLPPNAISGVQDKIPTFASEITSVEAQVWSSADDLYDLEGGEELESCLAEEGSSAGLGDPIRVSVLYKQNILLPRLFIGEDFLQVRRSATVTSSRIESGNLEEAP